MRSAAAAVLESVHGEDAVLEEMRVEATIDDLLAEVAVTQRYRNPESTNIEAVYTFPLPLDGALLGFEVEIGDRTLAGVVVEKAEGERRYEDAITDGDSAVLLEQAEPRLCTASVGNLMPGESAVMRFRYGLLLRWNGDRVRFAMPTTIAPRYGDPASGGLSPHQEPEHAFDAERAFGLEVTVRGLLEDARFGSPSHGVTVASEAGATVIALAGAAAMDRDFVLEARSFRPEAAGALVARDPEGWVALASFRPEIPVAADERGRSVKIAVDCSGSMGGDSIAQARTALERVLDGLRAGDLFEIVAFGSRHRALFGREAPVSEATLAEARRFVRALDADMGGTEIGAALEAAYAIEGAPDLPRDLLLVTDGQVWNGDEVVARAKRSGHRFFTVGVSSAVAEAFVRGLAEATGGACEFVAPREDMAERIHRHFQRMYAPRARIAVVRWPAPTVRSQPRSVETVYGGDTVHVFAWFAERPEGEVGLEVTLADGRTANLEARIPAVPEGSAETPLSEDTMPPALARIGAARSLTAMDDDEAAVELAVRHQLVSRWTSCVVVHVRADDGKAKDLPKIVKVKQTLSAGWHGMGTVHARSLRETAIAFSPSPAPIDGMACRQDVPDLREMRAPRGEVPEPVTPAELAELLNGHSMPPFPTLDVLLEYGVPDALVEALRNLVDQGEDEEALVLAFLHFLAEAEAGDVLDRRARRPILRAFKARSAHGLPLDAVASKLKDFPGWEGLLPTRGSAGRPGV